jgi:hypothetical protein
MAVVGILITQFLIYIDSTVSAFKPSNGGVSATDQGPKNTPVPSISEQSNLTGKTQQGPNQNITQPKSSPPLGIHYYRFPEIDFSSEQISVQLSNGTQIEVPKTSTYSNGTTIDTLNCIKTMTPAYGPDDAIVSCGPFIRTYQ